MQMWRALAISLIFMVLWYFHTEQVVGSCSTYVICLMVFIVYLRIHKDKMIPCNVFKKFLCYKR